MLYSPDYHKQFHRDRRNLILKIYEGMILDYGVKFTKQFIVRDELDEVKVHDWKCRLLDFAKPYADGDVVDAVDLCCERKREFPPDLREIQSTLRENDSIRRQKAQQEASLRRAKTPINPVGLQEIQELRTAAALQAAQQPEPKTDEEKLETLVRWRNQVFEHETLILPHCNDRTYPQTRQVDEGIKYFLRRFDGVIIRHRLDGRLRVEWPSVAEVRVNQPRQELQHVYA